MTLIAIHAGKESATVLTDTLAYTHYGQQFAHTSKVLTLPHLNAAVATQGESMFATLWKSQTLILSQLAPDFDSLVNGAPAEMRALWEDLDHAEHAEATVFLVGYSADREAFAAWGFAHEDDFAPFPIDGVFVTPSPLNYRPSHVEARRSTQVVTEDGLQAWLNQPPCPTPEDIAGWAQLGLLARRQRAVEASPAVLIGGSLHLTELTERLVYTSRLLDFDDSGEEFAQMVAGTLHPVAQLAACPCGSGKRSVECCIADALDGKPCPCESGKAFEDCCRVTTPVPETAA